ncbi:sensor histidine kinase, partial [Dubosiella newyorkensis]|uniref:sensor histidine kinase n=1 Tax=Dubosiella newyorkensis TaxID=1862672 RepID=UPI00259CBB7C
MARQKMNARETDLGWYLEKGQEHHYLCRMVEQNGCYIISFYNLSQVVTNASIFYEQRGELVLFTRKEILANSRFLENHNMRLDYDFNGDYYFSDKNYEYIVTQEQFINFKIALIEPYSSMNNSIRLLYLSPVLYVAVAVLALAFELFYLRSMLFHPLAHLVRVMEQIQTGNLHVRLEGLRSAELFKVQQTFNAMVTELVNSRIKSYEQKLEIERSQLNSLKMQIRPHFYLNCLKGIFGLAQSGKNAKIQEAVLCLSRHMRYVMDIDTDMIPLEQEIKMCENYIQLQKECECGSPKIYISVDPKASIVMVPPVSLLT